MATIAFYDVENLVKYKYCFSAIETVKKTAGNGDEGDKRLLHYAYADWSRIDKSIAELFIRNGASLKQVVNGVGFYNSAIKNASDIALAIDAIEMVIKNSSVKNVLICSGDGGYISLLHKVKEHGRNAIVISVENHLNGSLASYASECILIPVDDAEKYAHAVGEAPSYQRALKKTMKATESIPALMHSIFGHALIRGKIESDGLMIQEVIDSYMRFHRDDSAVLDFSRILREKAVEYGYEVFCDNDENCAIVKEARCRIAEPTQTAEEIKQNIGKEETNHTPSDKEYIHNVLKVKGIYSENIPEIKQLFEYIARNYSILSHLSIFELREKLNKSGCKNTAAITTVMNFLSYIGDSARKSITKDNYQNVLTGRFAMYLNTPPNMCVNKEQIKRVFSWEVA